METQTVSQNQKRQIAFKISLKTLKSGNYVQQEGWQPNYIETAGKKISRANIIAVIISQPVQENNSVHFIIDDGTDNIQVRKFEESEVHVQLGDIVNIIGRPREYNGERYVIPEIIKKIDNPKWAEVRKKELEREENIQEEENKIQNTQEKPQVEEVFEEENQNISKIIQTIKESDNGDGAVFEEVIEKSGIEFAEKILTNLLKEGEIFEIAPGKLKVLD